MLVAALLPAYLTLRTVARPAILVQVSDDPTPYGYTWSLSLWIVPFIAIVTWFYRQPGLDFPRRAFWITVAILVAQGVILDILFGSTFFTFPNAGATLQVYAWGFDLQTGTWMKDIPVEEFGFYFFGVAVNIALYLWSDLAWFGRYSRDNGRKSWSDDDPEIPLVRPQWSAALVGVVLIVLATIYKKELSPVPCGFPGYFAFLIVAAFIPASVFYASVRDHISWRAFSFSALTIFTISMFWEATVAFPYQWWGYRPEMMIGIFIDAWNGLPIEEPFLWLLVSFTSVIIFEMVHLRQLRRARRPDG